MVLKPVLRRNSRFVLIPPRYFRAISLTGRATGSLSFSDNMSKVLEKVERALGEKLFLKGARCAGPKCAIVRRGYPPGLQGKKKKRRTSEYQMLLVAKQKIRYSYGLDDKEVSKYSKEAVSKRGIFSSLFLAALERRLDNVVFRLGFAASRRSARQMVSHGHIRINDRMVNIPSYRVKTGETVSIKESSLGRSIFSQLDLKLKKYDPPVWLELDKEKKIAKIMREPEIESLEANLDVAKVKEFYSR